MKYLRDIEKLIAKKITVIENHPFPLVNNNPVKITKQQAKSSPNHSKPNSSNSKKNNSKKTRGGNT
jgi:ATP-dependent RNA helicase RhlE